MKPIDNLYRAHRPVCGRLQTKVQQLHVNTLSQSGDINETENAILTNSKTLQYGKFYKNLSVYWCCCTPCCVPMPITSFEFELEGGAVAETSIPPMCPCLGPFPVKHRGQASLGELDPHLYICQDMPWSLCIPCSTLDVINNTGEHIYTISRVACTCLCCTKWEVKDKTSQVKGGIQMGGCCWPYADITLPNDSEPHKQLILGSLGVLP